MKQVSEMNLVEQQMISALRSGEEESAVECAKVAEDVAIAYTKWLSDNNKVAQVSEESRKLLYDHFITRVYKKK